jgi:lipoprotein releasing system ATP-binding protein
MLKVENIHKIYKQPANQVHVLRGIDLNIAQGDVFSIVGPSGAGKSTLLHILGGLDKPDEGRVIFDDQDIYKLSGNKRAKIRNQKIGFIFQFYHLLSEFSALENVLLPALVSGGIKEHKVLKRKASDLLDRVGLKDRVEHRPSELSGGEQQRVAIARALINDPRIVFCDEPTGNLDSENGKAIIDLLLELNKKNEQTLVIVTHDESIAEVSRKVVHMRDGILV